MEGIIQGVYPLQGLIADGRIPLTARPSTMVNGDPLSQDLSWLDLLPPMPDQSASPVMTAFSGGVNFDQESRCLAVVPLLSTLSLAGQIPEALAVAQMAPAPDRLDSNVRDAADSRPPTDHSPEQRVTFPFAQINNAQFHDPNPLINEFHGPRGSLQPFSYMPVTHLMHPDLIADALECIGPQRDPDITNVRGPRHRGTGSNECPYCGQGYGRPQELKRHIRDKHRTPPMCPFCGIQSTRAEKIRKHLTVRHRDCFSSEERQDICRLRGWKATIRLLERCGTIARTGRSRSHEQARQTSRRET